VFGAEMRYEFPMTNSSLSPYLLGGLGMGNVKIGDLDIPGYGTVPGASETKIAFNFGAGFGIKAGEAMSIFVEGRFLSVLTEGESMSFIPLTAGIRF
jgi:opacity protein-like surface antigen